MKKQSILAAALALSLALSLAACARPNRRPTLPAARLTPAVSAETAPAPGAQAGARSIAGTTGAQQEQESIKELLDAFTSPLEAGSLYQDYTEQHRAQYRKLRARGEEALREVLPELLGDVSALACYTDETSRTTLLYCLMKDILQDEPFSWDGDGYRYISDMLAEFIQFVSGRVLEDGEEALAESAPLISLCADILREKPALRLNMTACLPIVNAQILTNAKLVFAAALEGKDAAQYGFEAWPENIESAFGANTDWTLTQDESGAVTLTAEDPESGTCVKLQYLPNPAEKASLLYGYGGLVFTKADGEEVLLNSQNWDMGYAPASAKDPVQDDELVLENGVEIGMDYNTVCALVGSLDSVWSDTMAGMGLASCGVCYNFQYDGNLIMRLTDISFRFAEDTWLNETSELPAARGIRLNDTIEAVFEKLPAKDTVLKRWAVQEVYGWDVPENGQAELQFVADSFYSLTIRTPGGRNLSITFARLDNTVKWMDIS